MAYTVRNQHVFARLAIMLSFANFEELGTLRGKISQGIVIDMRSLTLLLTLGIIWGSGYTIAKFTIVQGVPPLGYAFWQSLGPALLVGFAAKAQQCAPKFDKQHTLFYFICGLLGIAIPNTNMYFIAAHIPAGILAVMVNTVPIITYPLALMFRQEKFDVLRLTGVILGFAGIFFIVVPHPHWQQFSFNGWELLALLSPLSFALCAIYITAKRDVNASALTLSSGMLITSTILLLPLLIFTNDYYQLWPPFKIQDYLVMLEILLSSLGYILFFKLLSRAGPVYYSLVGCIVTLTGLVLGWLVFTEQLSHWNFLAVALILLSIYLVSKRQSAAREGT